LSSKRRSLGWACAIALALTPALLFAQDVIFKQDGTRLKGTIVKESSKSVKIKTLGGTLKVSRDEILRIERDGDVFRTFSARKRKLKGRNFKGWYALGTWAQDQELYPQAIDCFHEVIQIEPDHEEARWELGYRRSKTSGDWVTESDYFTERGYKRWEGRWVSAGDFSKLDGGLVKVDGHWVPKDSEQALKPRKRKRSTGKAKRETPVAKKDARRGRARFPWAGQPIGGQQAGGAKLSDAERKAQLANNKTQGSWSVAYSSKEYDFYSNGPEPEVRKLAKTLDRMHAEYKRIFKFDQDSTRPFPVHLYGSQREFMSRTRKGPGTGGFYDGHKIVGFHGKLGSLSTESVLFHEGTHQFQGLVLGRNMWKAKIWLIEGLAVYFEACKVEGRKVKVEIPKSRLSSVRRAIRAGNHVPLATLIRMEQAQFGALHYAHAWSLIHFLVNGAKGGKKRFIEYWEKTKEGHEGVKLFEDLFNRPMSDIEAAWKDYVLKLS
jgi:hypothetical protein